MRRGIISSDPLEKSSLSDAGSGIRSSEPERTGALPLRRLTRRGEVSSVSGARVSIYLGGYTERVEHTTRGVVADTLAQDLKETLANVGAEDGRVLFLDRS